MITATRLSTVMLAAVAAALWAPPERAAAQIKAQEVEEARRDEALIMLENRFRRGRDIDEARQALISQFQKGDLDGGGVGPSDARLMAEQAAARGRLRQIQDWLRHDLDGDGRVTDAELRRALSPMARRPLRSAAGELDATEEQVTETLDRLVEKAARYDRDGDGVATFDEALATVRADESKRFDPRLGGGDEAIPAVFDLDGDGVIRKDEFIATFDLLLSEFDADGDKSLSDQERALLREASSEASRRQSRQRTAQRQANRLRRQGRDCGFPDLADDARLTVINLGEGAAVPTAALHDVRATTLADLEIEAGDEPLYLVVSADSPMLLRFSGAVERVAALVLVDQSLGVLGLEKEQAVWLDPTRCLALGGPRSTRRSGRPLTAQAAVQETARLATLALGRGPDQTATLQRAGRIKVPSGAPVEEQAFPGAQSLDLEGAAGPIWDGFLKRYPGGLVAIDPAQALAPAPLRADAPPPGRAGIARLLEEGAVRVVSEEGWGLDVLPEREDGALLLEDGAFFDRGGQRVVLHFRGVRYRRDPEGDWRRWEPPVYEVLEAFKVPPGLDDQDQVVFRVRPGGPKPYGPLGDSKVEIAGQ